MTYSEKLRDPRWQKKRLEIMSRDDFRCQACRSKEKTLNVHHRVYRKGKAPWEYEDDQLVTFCEDCHEKVEDSIRLLAEAYAFDDGIKTLLKWWADYEDDERFELANAVSQFMQSLDEADSDESLFNVQCAERCGAELIIVVAAQLKSLGMVRGSLQTKAFNERLRSK